MQYAFNYKINQSFETKDTDTFNQLKKMQSGACVEQNIIQQHKEMCCVLVIQLTLCDPMDA